MISGTETELLSFASRVLEKQGGLVDYQDDLLLTLLPSKMARTLEVPEEAQIGGPEHPLLYGSPLLDRLIQMATREIPIVYGQLEIPYLKKEGFESLIRQDLVFADGQIKIISRAESRVNYMVLICHYVALSDERKEGLVRLAVQEGNGALIPGFEDLLAEFQITFIKPGGIPPHFPVPGNRVLSSALEKAQGVTADNLGEFLKSMKRRLQRDINNTREYFQALEKEMRASLKAGRSEVQDKERMEKIQALPQELSRKTEDLLQKYQVEVTITGCAALRFLVPVAQILLQIRYRKLERTVSVTWNPVTRRIDPTVCEQCSETIQVIYPWIKGSQIMLGCLACSKK
jgi:hypothetical protein